VRKGCGEAITLFVGAFRGTAAGVNMCWLSWLENVGARPGMVEACAIVRKGRDIFVRWSI
jgi:hypothetical protein